MFKRFLAAAVTAATMAAAPQARADDWGCEVLLCLSNPAGPMAVAQCVPPIQRLYRAIFKWRPDPFPTCLMSNGQDSSSGGNYAHVAPASYYDACPAGTSALSSDVYAAKGRAATPAEQARMPAFRRTSFVMTSSMVRGIGSGAGYSPSSDDGGGSMPSKVCVGSYLGQTRVTVGMGDDREQYRVNVYDRLVLIDPAADTFNINVYVDNALFRNIRPFSQSTMRDL